MDYPTLLLQLENQLQSLHKKGFHYMNIEAMPKVELRRLLDGLGEILDSPTEDVDKRSKYNFSVSAATQPAVKIKHENADSKIFPPSTGITDLQEKLSAAKQQTVLEAFKQLIPEPEAEIKVSSLSELADKYKSCQRCSLGKLLIQTGL